MRPAHYRTRDILTARQREVLGLIARGYTNPQIAAELGITLDGAKFQVSEILSRLDVATRDEAAAWYRAERRPVGRVANVVRGLAAIPLRWLAVGAVASLAAAGAVAAVILFNPSGPSLATPSASGGGTAAAVLTPCTPVDGPGFVRLNGVTYVPVFSPGRTLGWDPGSVTLGAEFARVLVDWHNLPCDGGGRTPIDGDAIGLREGQALYEVAGYIPSFRLAARQEGYIEIYQAQSNENARTGADLLDIGGKVRSIGVVEIEYLADGPQDRPQGAVADSTAVGPLVTLLLASPVELAESSPARPPYRLDITLDDGSVIQRNYFPDNGTVTGGGSQRIVTPLSFLRELAAQVNGSLVKALDRAQATPTPTALPRASACPVTQPCEFATLLSGKLRSDPASAILTRMAPVTLACPPTGEGPPGLDSICNGLDAGTPVTGMTYGATAKAWAFLPVVTFTEFVSGLFSGAGYETWRMVAVGCPGSGPTALQSCASEFAISAIPPGQPGAAIVLFYALTNDGPRLHGLANWTADSPAVRGGAESFGIYDADGIQLASYWFQPWAPQAN